MDASIQSNDIVRRWQRQGWARHWVEQHNGIWDHGDWLGLLHHLQRRGPVGPTELGRVLEEAKLHFENLGRWLTTGVPQRWVASHKAEWTEDEYRELLKELQSEGPWPLDPDQVRELLDSQAFKWRNLQRWLATGEAPLWVEMHQGAWDHADWLGLIEQVQATFGEVDPDLLGQELERCKASYWNLRRWIDDGGAREWVSSHHGVWTEAEWAQLLADVELLYGPVDGEALGLAVEEARRRHRHLLQWLATGQGRLWVKMHRGVWDHGDWLALLDALARSGWWPLDPIAVGMALDHLKREYHNLARWKLSGEAVRWLHEHEGRWSQADVHALIERLRVSEYWPIPIDLIDRVLEAAQANWRAA